MSKRKWMAVRTPVASSAINNETYAASESYSLINPFPAAPPRVVGTFRLTAILFFLAYGGSFGVEEAISYGPPFYVLLAFLVAPFAWGLPEALVTAELSSVMPNLGGNLLWAKHAFGDVVSWQAGFWALIAIPTGIAIYPNFFVNFLMQIVGDFHFIWKLLIHLGIVIFITVVNVVGIKTVSGWNIIFSGLLLLPFFVLVVVGFTKGLMHWGILMERQWDGTFEWGNLATTAIWSCGGWTNGGMIAGEIHRPGKSFFRAVFIVLTLTLVFSLFPIATAICALPGEDNWKNFTVGYWAEVANSVGGTWLKTWMAVGGMLAALGEMNSVLCSQARLLQYLSFMVEFFPTWFAPMHRKFKTPYISVITLGVVCFFVSLTPFKTIMSLVVTLASISLLITYACLAFLRYKDPYLHSHVARPFKIPLGLFGVGMVCLVGGGVCIFNLVMAPWPAKVGGAVLVVMGIIVYYLCKRFLPKVEKNVF